MIWPIIAGGAPLNWCWQRRLLPRQRRWFLDRQRILQHIHFKNVQNLDQLNHGDQFDWGG
jgi:hypothetical protein